MPSDLLVETNQDSVLQTEHSSADDDSNLEISEGNGLLIIYNEKEGNLTINWNEDTHPEYNFLNNCSSENILKMLLCHLENNPDSQVELIETSDVIQE